MTNRRLTFLIISVILVLGYWTHLGSYFGSYFGITSHTRGQPTFIPPTIDGNLTEPCWSDATNISFHLVDWEIGLNHPSKPSRNWFNGTLSILYDEDALYIGMRIYNATNILRLSLLLDDNVTEIVGGTPHRGVSYYREDTWTYFIAGELRQIAPPWWGGGYHDAYIYYESEEETFAKWVWQHHEYYPVIDISYTMEGAFNFRTTINDPPWLLEKVPLIRLQLQCDISKYNDYRGWYVFPEGTNRGASTDENITHWFPITTDFPPHTPYNTPTLPLFPPWVPAVIIGAITLVTVSFILILIRRNKRQ